MINNAVQLLLYLTRKELPSYASASVGLTLTGHSSVHSPLYFLSSEKETKLI
jgi:hypothetical protein